MAETLISPDHRPVAVKASGPIRLVGLGRKEIAQHLTDLGEELRIEPKKVRMRTKQIFHWIYNYGVTDWDQMTNIAKPMREKLAQYFSLERPEIVERLVSEDGTRKYLIRMSPGVEVETVFIPDVSKTGALCVSSQVGCTLTCKFCHTGTQRLVRNLTPAEIVLQVIIARDDLGEWPTTQENRKLTNIVFMGMGEPLYNTQAVGDSLDTICDPEGLGIGRRRITVSTSGVVPEIGPMGERTSAMLAISLHAANDELREQIMPINRKYPLKDLMQACRDYPGLSNSKRITFEYVMLKGINDQPWHAKQLIKLLKGIPAKVNLIPFNPWPGTDYECSDWETIEAFADQVNRAGYASPIRTPRGRDIFAACGQLKSESEKKRASDIRKDVRASEELS
ncbi:23S rRNA (adenine(2503)-C(2))-methyltransferase RlmN [Litorimonas sp. RW-G-Af-16]|uniref:23S rRNA (adenine(2503)-C(2))-methyltransferase RlmN n=1 Tax=Litorimonas sp. RW-G-Af-16 TaxID=3241168 RepID=UPI00390C6A9B